MKSCYHIRLSPVRIAIADLTDYYGMGKVIIRINVPQEFRGQGHARSLLSLVLNDADRESVVLLLEISSSDGLSYNELEAWYTRRGFARWHGIYRRKPRSLHDRTQDT